MKLFCVRQLCYYEEMVSVLAHLRLQFCCDFVRDLILDPGVCDKVVLTLKYINFPASRSLCLYSINCIKSHSLYQEKVAVYIETVSVKQPLLNKNNLGEILLHLPGLPWPDTKSCCDVDELAPGHSHCSMNC